MRFLLSSFSLYFVFTASATLGFMYEVRREDSLPKISKSTKKKFLGKTVSLQASNHGLIFPSQKIKLIDETPARRPTSDDSISIIKDNAGETPHQNNKKEPFIPKGFKPHSSLMVLPRVSFSRFDATDLSNGTHATVLSNVNRELSLSWIQSWTEKFQSSLFAGINSSDFEPSTTNIKIQNPTQILSRIGASTSFRFHPRAQVTLRGAVEQELFFRGLSPNSVNLDRLAIPNLEGEVSYDLIRMDPLELGVAGGGGYYFPLSTDLYGISQGTSTFGKVYLRDAGRAFTVQGEFQFKQINQSSTIAAQKFIEIGLGIGFIWRFERE